MPSLTLTAGRVSVPQRCSVLGGEMNTSSIRALDERIRAYEAAIVRPKRARNSLLNVSKLPPEILGDIFRWNVALKEDFGGLEKGSHNFLLVCHHWFEVASCTPEVWSFWGNNLQDWKKRHRRYPTARLDLVLNGEEFPNGALDDSLRNAIQDRARRDTVRSIHLFSNDSNLLGSIVSPLTIKREEIQPCNVESVVLWGQDGKGSADVSDFFIHRQFPKLRRLELGHCTISSWDLLTSRTSALTTLVLGFSPPSPTPTMSQLLSILGSNPSLREISLFAGAIPDDGGHSSSRVWLPHLKDVVLMGNSRYLFRLLRSLDYPRNMDRVAVIVTDCTIGDVSEVIGPCLWEYLRFRGRSPGLGLHLSSKDHIELHVGDVHGSNSPASGTEMDEFVEIIIKMDTFLSSDDLKKTALNLISHIPQEEVVYLQVDGDPIPMEDVPIHFPSLRTLRFKRMALQTAFPHQILGVDRYIFPSLKRVALDRVHAYRGDWSPLENFLACQASSGSRLETLRVDHSDPMSREVEKNIKGLVQGFWMTGSGGEI